MKDELHTSLNSVRTLTNLTVIVLFLWLTYIVLRPFIAVIITSFVLTVFLAPIYNRIVLRIRISSLSAIITLILFTIVVVAPISLIVTAVISEAASLVKTIQDQPDLISNTQSYLIDLSKNVGMTITPSDFDFQDELVGMARTLSLQLGSILARTGSTIFKTIFVFLTTFFLLMYKRDLKLYVLHTRIVPREYFVRLEQRTRDLINGIVRGNLLIFFLQVIVSTTVFNLFSLPAPVLLGFVYGTLGFLPAVGPSLLWIPLTIIMVLTGQIWLGLIMALVLLTSNILVDNILGPRIIGNQTKLHQVVVMFAVLGGIARFGLLGVILGPTIIALTLVSLDMFRDILSASVHTTSANQISANRKKSILKKS